MDYSYCSEGHHHSLSYRKDEACRLPLALMTRFVLAYTMTSTSVPQASSLDRDAALADLVIAAALGQDERVRAGITSLHTADIAELLDVLEEAETKQRVFGFLPPQLASEVLSFVAPPTQEILTRQLSDAVLGAVVEHIESDDAVDLKTSRFASTLSGSCRMCPVQRILHNVKVPNTRPTRIGIGNRLGDNKRDMLLAEPAV